MLDWKQLVRLPEAQLAQCDIAEVNLACAAGLPDAAHMNVPFCLQKLDQWAAGVQGYTYRCYSSFLCNPERYEHSEPYFNALCLITYLQRDLGVRYNQSKIPEDAIFEAEDSFIFGVLQGPGGTCASLPVVYTAVGRRLGYPMKLASARGKKSSHCYCRWDDGITQMNIEGSGLGLNTPPDSYYKTGKYAQTDEQVELGGLVRSKTPREELSNFMFVRGLHLQTLGEDRAGVEALAWSHALAPRNRMLYNTLVNGYNKWMDKVRVMAPPGFPPMDMWFDVGKRFPGADADVEKMVYQLEALDGILQTPELNRRWWEPMRRGQYLEERPTRVLVRINEDGFSVQYQTSRNSYSHSN